MLQKEKKLAADLNKDNEVFANELLQIVRKNISMYKIDEADQAKFLQEKKKEILAVLQQHDLEYAKKYNQELCKLSMRKSRRSSEAHSAKENRSFAKQIKTDFDRTDTHSAIKSKNLGIVDA